MKDNKKINILATGCGGDLGASVGRICKSSNLIGKVIGCNNHDRHFSKYIYDKYFVVDNFNTENYKLQIDKIVKAEDIDLIIPLSEIELRMISDRNVIDEYSGIPYLSANKKSLEVGFDKLKTIEFLKDIGVSFPKTIIFSELKDELSYPYIIKSRSGYGSKSIFKITSETEKNKYLKDFPDFIAQEYIDVDDQEYTCGLFSSSDGKNIRSITMHRNLYEGTTSYGSVRKIELIKNLLHKIAEGLQLNGSINVQLRLTAKGPLVFEINPRFSSTVRFRHLMGYMDLIWSIEDLFNKKISDYKDVNDNTHFYRDSNEVIVNND